MAICSGKLQKDRFFYLPLESRTASREFVTAMGVKCYDYKTSSAIWEALADRIIETWDEDEDLFESTPEKLQAFTMVTYASAMEPGGEFIPFFQGIYVTISPPAFRKGFV